MPLAVGIDPGTVTFDVCGLHDGAPSFADTLPTSAVADDPDRLAGALARRDRPDVVVAPSGYGLPLRRLRELGEPDLRLAFLSRPGGSEGIPGLVAAVDRLRRLGCPVWIVPGVVHLPSVPAHRKVNRMDMGTADKLCAAALGITDQARRRDRPPAETDFLLAEVGGAFTSVLSVREGAIVDGLGGSSGPPGVRAPGTLDAEVAVLLGRVTKRHVFSGGAGAVARRRQGGAGPPGPEGEGSPGGPRRDGGDGSDLASWADGRGAERIAWDHLMEGIEKACRALTAGHPDPTEVLVSGRHGSEGAVLDRLRARLADVAPVRPLQEPPRDTSATARGAAVLADGLAGGDHAEVVESLRLREASGTIFDHLYLEGADRAAARWLEGGAP